MNHDYEAFCMANPAFYDAPANSEAEQPYQLGVRSAPAAWERHTTEHWVIYSPVDHALPNQGWKVHVAGCLDNAERIMEAVWDYCIERDISFKFLRSPRVVLARNAKYAGRGGSGKLVTVYPHDEAELAGICVDLDHLLAGEHGPYILSDLRWGAGPVHVRYGGFAPRYCEDEQGAQVLAIEDGAGVLVPDVRGPVFSLPAWLTPPDCLAPHLAARAATTVADIPYTVDEALHFSNGGGVYLGTDRRSGQRVVLKEARPYAGLSGDGTDAVVRLRREGAALERLAGIDAVPRLLDRLTVGEHEFLVMDHIDGEGLNSALARRCPLLDNTADATTLADYADWALAVHRDVEQALAEIHERGIVYGDLHLFNVIVRPDGRVALIDFEVAADVASGRRPTLGAMGFVAPRDRVGFDIDHYALACLRLALFVPLERLTSLDRTKAAHLAAVAGEHFPVPQDWLDQAVEVIAGQPATQVPYHQWRLEPDTAGWQQARTSIGAGILASATPHRHDRLFPGDIRQFDTTDTGGLNLAYGAAGVLYALDATGAGRHPELEEWLIREARAAGPSARLGLYDGLHGIAHVLARLGHPREAAKLVDRCLGEPWQQLGDDLHGGLAGMGLNLAHMADTTDDPALDAAALRATQLVADRLGAVDDVPEISGGHHPLAGLMHGGAGRALLFVRMFERTGDPALLDHAAIALRQDLRRCVRRQSDGQLHVNEGHRTLPYLAVGSTGIGLVLRRYLACRADDELADALASITDVACGPFYVQSGLFNGRAGMVLYLADSCRAAARKEAPAGGPPPTELSGRPDPRTVDRGDGGEPVGVAVDADLADQI
ncbi:MAG TPA: class III lanthionine synthetase LanKC, partial [Acidimicrobiales bacterium]|nr:class III lanthionine synthetase LanKC [Acidimicrobiales bacterium]